MPTNEDVRAWTDTWYTAHVGEGPTASIDLAAFTEAARAAALPLAEALRQLAILADDDVYTSTPFGPERWPVVKAIYEAALSHHPDHPDVLTSLAIDASENAQRAEGDAAAALWHTAHTAAERALAVAPTDAHGWFVRGRVRYDDPAVPVADALADFEAALRLDPTHREARMFVGHSLRDLHRWDEAAAAFAAVDRAAVVDDAYRVDELEADCLLRAGRVAEATARFAAALDAMEPLEDIWFGELLFEAAAAGALPALADRVAALRQRVAG